MEFVRTALDRFPILFLFYAVVHVRKRRNRIRPLFYYRRDIMYTFSHKMCLPCTTIASISHERHTRLHRKRSAAVFNAHHILDLAIVLGIRDPEDSFFFFPETTYKLPPVIL